MPSFRHPVRLAAAVALLAAVAAVAVPSAGARAAFGGNVCSLVGKAQLTSAGLPAGCKEGPSGSRTLNGYGTLTAWMATFGRPVQPGQKVHFMAVIVVKASDPAPVLAYLRHNKDVFLRQLGLTGQSQRATTGGAERWFLAGGSYGAYVALEDQGASKAKIDAAIAAIEAEVKGGL